MSGRVCVFHVCVCVCAHAQTLAEQTGGIADSGEKAVGLIGDVPVTYSVFMRRPVVCCPRVTTEWLEAIARSRGVTFEIELTHAEGEWVGAGVPLMYLSGPLYHLVDLETLYLQKLGAACVAAYNAYEMCKALPNVSFLAMDARHCAGTDMADLMAYAASVGSAAAKREVAAAALQVLAHADEMDVLVVKS